MLSVQTTRQIIPPATTQSKSERGGAAAREKRVLMGLSLDLVAQRCKKLGSCTLWWPPSKAH